MGTSVAAARHSHTTATRLGHVLAQVYQEPLAPAPAASDAAAAFYSSGEDASAAGGVPAAASAALSASAVLDAVLNPLIDACRRCVRVLAASVQGGPALQLPVRAALTLRSANSAACRVHFRFQLHPHTVDAARRKA